MARKQTVHLQLEKPPDSTFQRGSQISLCPPLSLAPRSLHALEELCRPLKSTGNHFHKPRFKFDFMTV